MTAETVLYQPKWRIIDQSAFSQAFDAEQSFGMDDMLCESVGNGESLPTARTWVHHNTIVLGIQDARLPFVKGGIDYLRQKGYRVIIRNSGGLAVVLDEGILNLSLIFSERQKVNIDQGYEAMAAFTRRMLEPYEIEVHDGEVEGSYCPGRFDLSIDGKKFAGISQRRIRHGVAVQIYMCVDGSGADRASIIQEFYRRSFAAWETKTTYPKVRPETMASLSELTGENLDVRKVMSLCLMALKHYGSEVVNQPLTPHEIDLFYTYYKRVLDRSNKALSVEI
ncbi:MAG TPA: biotin/lipoate A/B protein ligase family protein [Bacillales bacterium]|nr:biotin/lipoate A/B protein ligase family protein [Bacillales bacterium]